jgi:hypothetical protein
LKTKGKLRFSLDKRMNQIRILLKILLLQATAINTSDTPVELRKFPDPGVEKNFGQAQGFLNFFNPSPVSDLPSPNL